MGLSAFGVSPRLSARSEQWVTSITVNVFNIARRDTQLVRRLPLEARRQASKNKWILHLDVGPPVPDWGAQFSSQWPKIGYRFWPRLLLLSISQTMIVLRRLQDD
jgi:hypothetical protein